MSLLTVLQGTAPAPAKVPVSPWPPAPDPAPARRWRGHRYVGNRVVKFCPPSVPVLVSTIGVGVAFEQLGLCRARARSCRHRSRSRGRLLAVHQPADRRQLPSATVIDHAIAGVQAVVGQRDLVIGRVNVGSPEIQGLGCVRLGLCLGADASRRLDERAVDVGVNGVRDGISRDRRTDRRVALAPLAQGDRDRDAPGVGTDLRAIGRSRLDAPRIRGS